MAALHDPVLSIDAIEGDPRRRLVTVRFALELDTDDHLVDHEIEQLVRLHAVDEHDAAVRPDTRPIAEHRTTFVGRAGRDDREVDFAVDRADLDVQQDWWSSGPGGETRPIAEWPDHIAADVVLSRLGRVVATVTSPTVTGSWGVLAQESAADPGPS